MSHQPADVISRRLVHSHGCPTNAIIIYIAGTKDIFEK
jgi:hypothetical protein